MQRGRDNFLLLVSLFLCILLLCFLLYFMPEPIKINMAEFRVGANPVVFTCVGLGSCVGIVLYEPIAKIGGLAHIMLPFVASAKDRSNKAKFADTAIDMMAGEMTKLGATYRFIKAKIFGGANMFPGLGSKTLMNVGERNVKAVKEILKDRKIRLTAEDTGGTAGRTIVFDITTGNVAVRMVSGDGEERVY